MRRCHFETVTTSVQSTENEVGVSCNFLTGYFLGLLNENVAVEIAAIAIFNPASLLLAAAAFRVARFLEIKVLTTSEK